MPYKKTLLIRFESTITQVKELLAIHYYLISAPVTQVSDNILRAALAMLVSTIDTTIHELIVKAIMYELKEAKSVFKIENIKIGISVSKELDNEQRLRLIESDLRGQYAKESIQSSRQIETALATIGITKIWTKLSTIMGMSPDNIKIQLDLLVRRRNQIVHEGDLDHLHNLREIVREDLTESLEFTKKLVNGIISEYVKLLPDRA